MKPMNSKSLRSSGDEEEDLSRSWTRTLSRSANSRISSADHVITIESCPGTASTTSARPATPPLSARAAEDAADSLTTPLLSAAADSQVTDTVSAAAEEQQQQQQQLDGQAPYWNDEEWAAKFPATAAAQAAAAAARGLKPACSPSPQLRQGGAAADSAAAQSAEAALRRKLDVAYGLSWAVNILLLFAKLYAFWISQSRAVLASAADSAVDLVSQVVIAYADWKMRTEDPRFPVGQARLEAIGVLACACIMSVASFEVISGSVMEVYDTLTTGEQPQLQLGLVMYVVLGSATALKLLCYVVCAALQSKSDSMLALAEDHLNDIMSNVCAIITAVLAGHISGGWWIDPTGAILISMYIVVRWLAIAKQQVDKIVGRGAPADFIQRLEALANRHHSQLGLDVIRAYHFGSRYIVEMEVVLPAKMSVRDSHDISLDLQHKVEQLEEVERAFVHVDYMRRDGLEHKVERELAIARAASLGGGSSSGSGSRHEDGASPTCSYGGGGGADAVGAAGGAGAAGDGVSGRAARDGGGAQNGHVVQPLLQDSSGDEAC